MSDPKPKRQVNGLMIALGVVGIILLAFLAGRQYLGLGPGPNYQQSTQTGGNVPIGGPFTLVGEGDKVVTDRDFRGAYMVVYFGYTYCPDVCPSSLSAVGGALDLLGKQAKRFKPVFISVDPERDSPEHLAEYVKHFHPSMVGLTGTKAQVDAVAKEYRVYYAKVVEKDKDGNPKPDDDYLMDHSSITYVMAPDGKFMTHFGHGTSAEDMAKKLAELP